MHQNYDNLSPDRIETDPVKQLDHIREVFAEIGKQIRDMQGPIAPTDPNVPAEDKPRLSRLAGDILARLTDGPATTLELAAITHRFGARIADLREHGYVIERSKGANGSHVYRLIVRP